MTQTPTARVPKRVRFEVLRRDNFTCSYCGATADDSKLHVDHVVPAILGGPSTPENLVTACEACNSGKSSTTVPAEKVSQVSEDARRWASAIQQAADERRNLRATREALLDTFRTEWQAWGWTDKKGVRHRIPLGDAWEESVQRFFDVGLDLKDLTDLIPTAMTSRADDTWRYFCKCAWNVIRELQDRASEIVSDPDAVCLAQPAHAEAEDAYDRAYRAAGGWFRSEDQSYWSGHTQGYDAGYQDGWEQGLAAGRVHADPTRGSTDPVPLQDLLRPPPTEENDAAHPLGEA